ncbi:MAG: hypothetical protein H6822_30420 [Planctomycetaceae bacterium]|nr:hypothetical protein [Planctomycetales bacterium]MCB9926499.1 hypothetical protein [Planctomycetaceae bacterium]
MTSASDDPQQSDQVLRCQCGGNVRFSDIDRGQMVYCDSCGTGMNIPTVDAMPEHQSSSTVTDDSAFSPELPADLQERVLKSVHCLCGREIEVTLRDLSQTLYCPSCGSGVPVTRSLSRRSQFARVFAEDDEAVTSPLRRPTSSSRGIKLVLTTIAAIVVGFASVIIGNVLRHDLPVATNLQDGSILHRVGPAGPTPAADEVDAAVITPEVIAALADNPDPFRALMLARAWEQTIRKAAIDDSDERYRLLSEMTRRILTDAEQPMLAHIAELKSLADPELALRSARDWLEVLSALRVADEDERRTQLEAMIPSLLVELNPITADMIESLLANQRPQEALIQAGLWRLDLVAQRAAERDARVVRLAEVAVELRGRLAPEPPNTDSTTSEFLRLLGRLASALRDGDLAAARADVATAEAMLAEHGERLATHQSRFNDMRERLQLLTSLDEEVASIQMLLQDSLTATRKGRVSKAMNLEAKSRLIAAVTTMTKTHASTLRAQASEVRLALRLAQGTRAVNDAIACQEQGDIDARDHEVRRAYQLLPGLAEQDIFPLLERIEPWKKSALFPREADTSSRSNAAKRIAICDSFESTLEAYAKGEIEQLLEASLEFHVEMAGTPDARPFEDQLIVNLLHALRIKGPDVDYTSLREKLSSSSSWKRDPRWQELARELTAASEELR